MKKLTNLMFLILFSVSLFTPFNNVSADNVATETFYAYKDAYYYTSQISTTYYSSWDGYYRVMYKHNYKTKSSDWIGRDSLSITNTYGQSGDVARYCFSNDKEYHITHIDSDIDYYIAPGHTYTQPQVSLYLGGRYIGRAQERSSSEYTNGHWDGDENATGKCLVWHTDDNSNRNRTAAGGSNNIKYYSISYSTSSSGWQWKNATDYKNSNSNIYSITGTTTGYLKPNWSTTQGWRSSNPYNAIKRGAYSQTTEYDRKSITYKVTYNANGGELGTMQTNITNNINGTNLSANGFTREGYKFIGWNTNSDGTGTSITDKKSISSLATDNGSITLYAQWEALDTEPPTINNQSVIKGACYYPDAKDGTYTNIVRWTNQNKTITLSATDNMKMKSLSLYNERGSLLKIVKASKDEKTLSFDYIFAKNGNFKLVAIDWNNNQTTYEFEIVCIDKETPKPNISLACGSSITFDTPVEVSFTDNLSGLSKWQYQYTYTKADGSKETSPVNEVFSNRKTVDITEKVWNSSSVDITITAYDNAGNIYSTTSCKYSVSQQYTTETVLNDYSQIIALYNKDAGYCNANTATFISNVTNLNTETSKAFLKIIAEYKKEDKTLTDLTATKKFIEDYGLSNQVITKSCWGDIIWE